VGDQEEVCPKCGKTIKKGWKVCVECGEIIRQPSLKESGEGKRRNIKKTAFIAVAGVVILLVLLTLTINVFKGKGEGCSKPEVRINGECCLNENKNSVCDKYETAESTTTMEKITTTIPPETSTTTSTTTITATSSSTTTTTTIFVRCKVNSDCGSLNETLICLNGDVYTFRSSPMCSNPGKPTAYCWTKNNKLEFPKEQCRGRHCVDGKCA